MSKRKNLIEFDSKIINPLPALKNTLKSAQSSPRFKLKATSPKGVTLNKDAQDSSEANEGFLIKKFRGSGKNKPKAGMTSISMSPKPVVLECVSILEKTLSFEDEDFIREPKSEYMQQTFSSISKKVELEIKRDAGVKNRFKDIEVADLKMKNQEYASYIDSLLAEIHTLRIKVKDLEENIERVHKNSQNSEQTIKNLQSIVKNSDSKLKELTKELKFKEHDLTEANELLKKSENKRKVTNDQLESIESTLVLFQRQMIKQNSTISDLTKLLESSKSDLTSHITQNELLTKKISSLESELEYEKMKLNSNIIDHERSRESLLSLIEQMKVKQEQLEIENQRVQELATHYQQDSQRVQVLTVSKKRKDAITEDPFLMSYSKEEASRWHSRYFALKEELAEAKESLEKYEKNNQYFKTQIEQKNAMIQTLMGKLKAVEKGAEDKAGVVEDSMGNT